MAPQLKIVACRPNGTTYSARIDDRTWNIYRDRLEEMHKHRLPRATMLSILEHDYDFHPSLPQLNARMTKWGYVVKASKQPDLNSASMEDPEQIIDLSNLTGSPISVPMLSREDSRDSDFSSPSGYSEPGRADSPVLVEEDNMEEDNMEEDSVEEDSVEEDSVEEDSVEEDSVEEDSVEEDSMEKAESRDKNEGNEGKSPVSPCRAAPKIARLPEYCSQSCCETLIRNHRYMIAAQLLASLRCMASASGILLPLVADMGSDSLVASSDHVWAKVNYNRLSGSLLAPDQRTSIWSTQDWRRIPGPLREYILSSGSTSLPSSLAHLSLTSQYRKTGDFTHYPSICSATKSSAADVRTLYEEILSWEKATSLLSRLMLSSLRSLKTSALRKELQQMSAHFGHLKEPVRLCELALPRLIGCHFLTHWIEEPCPEILEALVKLNASFGPCLSLEVMLPEVFMSFAHMVLAKVDHAHVTPGVFERGSFVDRFAGKLYTSLEEICRSAAENYCADFSEALLLICSWDLSGNTPNPCKYSEQLAEKLAYRIIGERYVGKYGFENAAPNLHLSWMPLAECFRVHEIPTNGHSPTTRQETVSPNTINQPAGGLTSSQGTYSESCAPSPLLTASALPARREVVPTIIDTMVEVDRCPSSQRLTSKGHGNTNTTLKRTVAIKVKRMNTNSSGMSLDSMRELRSRTQARQLAREIGLARNSTSSSGMTLGSQFSFTKVTGLARGNSTASKFSFTAESMSVDAISPSMEERLSNAHSEDTLTEEEAQWHRKVSEWITRELSQKKRPDFNRRSTEPAFMIDASRPKAEITLV